MTRNTRITALALLATLAFAPGCTVGEDAAFDEFSDDSRWYGDRATYVLVHGAFQDASSWDIVRPLLRLRGHKVLTVELPGRNGDTTPHGEISLADHVDAVASVIAAQSEPVILVGHSFGGIVISQVAEIMPERIDQLVYVAASLPRNGDSLAALSEEDHWNGFNENNFLISPDFTTASVLEEDRLGIFCADCRPYFEEKLLANFHDEPLAPLGTPVSVTEEGLGSVSKVYIKTLQDNAISTPMQELMLERTPVAAVFEIDTSHAPFFAAPRRLARILSWL